MKTIAGMWIDHRVAIIVTLSGDGETTLELRSGVESQPSREAGVPLDVPFEPLLVTADDSHQRQYTGQLDQYYGRVIAAISGAETLLLFGPGEAKGELLKRLGHARYGGHVSFLETADRMTDRQVAAKVREHFDQAPLAPGHKRLWEQSGKRPERPSPNLKHGAADTEA
jgi:hypothetical protein